MPNATEIECDDETKDRHERMFEQINDRLRELKHSEENTRARLVEAVATADRVRSDLIERHKLLFDSIDAEREERRRSDDSLREIVKGLADSLTRYLDEARAYRDVRTSMDSARDQALGIRVKRPENSDGEKVGPWQALGRVMMQPWWWKTIAAFGGGVTLKTLLDWVQTLSQNGGATP